ncbi:MAG TPA: AAA family ATPase [Steroidobacteraceae bacterium]|nr:AAA family ATPase [Steroidobacteraceae bacterium]
MIGKISTGKGYGGTIEYVLGPGEHNIEDRARVLWHTMESDNPQHWAIEMEEHARALNPDLVESGRSDLVVHVSLSAAPGERLSDVQWIGVASEYLREMGWEGHDHILVQHNDRPHDHIHLVINRVGQDGQTADLHDDYPRQAQALEAIERKFGLDLSHAKMRAEAEQNPAKAIESLTRSHLTFTAKDVERYFHRMGFSDAEVKELTWRALTAGNVLGTNDGKLTTSEIKQEVATLDGRFASLAARAHGSLDQRASNVDESRHLTGDQQRAREAILSGRGLVVIEGFAGSGKSTLVNQVRADLHANGYQVLGAAPTGKAADGLQASSGIESSTIASLLGQLERAENPLRLSEHTVLVIDEAAMARLDDISRLSAHVERAGGLLSMIGDSRQLAAVGHGGGLELAKQHAGSTVLDTIWRQSEGWQREATRAFGEGRAADAIQAYADHGAIHWSASIGSARADLIIDYIRAIDAGRSAGNMLAMAYRNEDVDKLNRGIREELKTRGMLRGEHTYRLTQRDGKLKDIELAQGDRVVLERNQKRLGISEEDVKNGMFGTVIHAGKDHFTVRLDKGSIVNIDPNKYGHVSHGYASTVHKAQGATIEKTFELASRGMGSNLTYVAMSRHKEETTLYANTADFKNTVDLVDKLSKSESLENFAKIMAAEGWLKQQGLDDRLSALLEQRYEQAAEMLAARPEISQKVQELGIAPEQTKSYIEDVIDVLEKHLGSPEIPSLGQAGPPDTLGAFRDAFQEWRASLDDWKHEPLVPMNRTEQVIYAVLDGAISAIWNGLSGGVQKGLSDEPGLLADLLRVTGQHLGAALEAGIEGAADNIGEAITGAKPSSELVERLIEREPEADEGEKLQGKDKHEQQTGKDKGSQGQQGKENEQQQGQGRDQEGKPVSREQQEQRGGGEKGGQSNCREKDQDKGESQGRGEQRGGQRSVERQSEGRQAEVDGNTGGKGESQDRGQGHGQQQEQRGGERQADGGRSAQAGGQEQDRGQGERKDRGQQQEQRGEGRGQQQERGGGNRQGGPSSEGRGQQEQRAGRDQSRGEQRGGDKSRGGEQRGGEGRQGGRQNDGRGQDQRARKSTGKAPTKGKGKTAAKGKAASKSKDSGKDRGYGRERYR